MSLVTLGPWGRSLWSDREGNPIDVALADRLLASHFYAVVAQTRISESYNPWIAVKVSTVWLACDITPGELFETMIFPSALAEECIGIGSGYQWRYPSESVAAAAHVRIVQGMRALFEDPVTENVKARALAPSPVRLAITKGE